MTVHDAYYTSTDIELCHTTSGTQEGSPLAETGGRDVTDFFLLLALALVLVGAAVAYYIAGRRA